MGCQRSQEPGPGQGPWSGGTAEGWDTGLVRTGVWGSAGRMGDGARLDVTGMA